MSVEYICFILKGLICLLSRIIFYILVDVNIRTIKIYENGQVNITPIKGI